MIVTLLAHTIGLWGLYINITTAFANGRLWLHLHTIVGRVILEVKVVQNPLIMDV